MIKIVKNRGNLGIWTFQSGLVMLSTCQRDFTLGMTQLKIHNMKAFWKKMQSTKLKTKRLLKEL